MHEIIPAILTENPEDFLTQIKKIEKFSSKIQIDVADGKFVDFLTFNPKTIGKEKNTAQLELHLMVKNPIKELKKWQQVKNIFRVIFHLEGADKPMDVINFIKENSWQAGLAISPDTPWQKAQPFFPHISELLFLTVYPGHQGAEFQPKVIKKIKQFSKSPQRPLCGADGGIRENNIKELKDSGVEIFNIGAGIVMADDPEGEYQKLKNLIN